MIATGVQYSVREFICWTAEELGITFRFKGDGEAEYGEVVAVAGDIQLRKSGDVIVCIDPRYFRPAEVETLLATLPRRTRGWVEPEITAREMCAEMVATDVEAVRRHALLKSHGYDTPVSRDN